MSTQLPLTDKQRDQLLVSMFQTVTKIHGAVEAMMDDIAELQAAQKGGNAANIRANSSGKLMDNAKSLLSSLGDSKNGGVGSSNGDIMDMVGGLLSKFAK